MPFFLAHSPTIARKPPVHVYTCQDSAPLRAENHILLTTYGKLIGVMRLAEEGQGSLTFTQSNAAVTGMFSNEETVTPTLPPASSNRLTSTLRMTT